MSSTLIQVIISVGSCAVIGGVAFLWYPCQKWLRSIRHNTAATRQATTAMNEAAHTAARYAPRHKAV